MINTRSIQFRLILWYSGLAIAVLLGFAAYTYQNVQRELYSDMEHTLQRRAGQIGHNILSGNPSAANVALQIHSVYSPEANNRFIRITGPNYVPLYVSGMPQDKGFDPAKIPQAKEPVASSRIEDFSGQGKMLLTAITTGRYLIEMGIPTDEIEQALHRLLGTLLYAVPIVIIIVSAGGYVLVRRSLQPVEDIRFTAQEITFGNLSNRLPVVTTGDALEHLSVTLNQMLDRLEHAYEQASRFSADASHELRTPLTIIRGELEAMLRTDMPAVWHERVASVLDEAERLSRITENLFAISRLDAGEAMKEHIPCDVAILAQSTAEQMLLLAEEKSITLAINASHSVMVAGDISRLKQVVVNLLDNAIKYTPERGHVALKVFTEASKAVLEVADNGVGIAPDALPHVFERFYRADKARSRDQGGAGLGLSIVRSIVQAHGGQVDIQSSEGKGTLFRMELPLLT